MDPGHGGGDADGPDHLIRRHGTHTDHQLAVEDPRFLTVDIGQVHGHVFALFDVPHGNPGREQLPFEGEGAADEEIYEILPPEPGDVGVLSGEFSVLPHPVLGNIPGDVRVIRHFPDQTAAHVAHLQQRAGFGVALGEQQKVIGLFPGQDQQIALGVAFAHAGGLAGDDALTDQGPDLPGEHFGIIHMNHPFKGNTAFRIPDV